MNLKLLGLATLLASTLMMSGCKNKGDEKTGSDNKLAAQNLANFSWSRQKKAAPQIKIINSLGEVVSGAMILIGDAQGSPFRDNFLSTDSRGQVSVPNTWTMPASVTVAAAGYIRQTILNQKPGDMVIRLNSAYLAQYAEIKGNVTDLPVVDKDKLADFALAMPMLTKSDLVNNIDLNQIISPYVDNFSAAGQKLSMPSNVSLPKQKESYSIITVTLDKPLYRLKTPTLGPKKFVAVRGRFVFKNVVDGFRGGKAFYELINDFTIHAGGVKDAVITGPTPLLDIPGNQTLFTAQIKVNASAPQSDEVALVLAGSDLNGYIMPTDVKRVTPGQPTNLQTIPSSSVQVVNLIKRQSEFMTNVPGSDRMSVSMRPYALNDQYKMLPLIANPQITNQGRYVINAQSLRGNDGINEVATTAVISDLIDVKEGEVIIKTPIRRWEIFTYGWQAQMTLPQWPLEKRDPTAASQSRVEVKYIGSSTSNQPNTLDFATHVTNASTDF